MRSPADKNTVVLVHGWASAPQVFRGLARALDKRLRVQLAALPGYGETAACVPYTLENMADTLAAAAPRQCDVIGWSLGAQVALAWARRAPRQVRRIALIAATPCFTQRADWPHAVAPSVMRQFTAQIGRDSTAVLRRFVALQSHGDARTVRVAHQLRTALFTRPLPAQDVLEAGLELLRTVDLRDTLPAVAQPALVIHGESDAVTPCAAGRALSALLPHAEFQAIAGAGHAPFLTDADGVAARLLAFMHESAAAV